MTVSSKHDLRSAIRAQLSTLTPEARAAKSRAICEAVARNPAFQRANRVMVFDAMPSEPDLAALWHPPTRQMVFPRVRGEELELIEIVHPEQLGAPVFRDGYREPLAAAGRRVEPGELDCVIVPGMAFTRDGHRLGRGGGYYDRLLARVPHEVPRLGVCFECQLVESLPMEAHDLAMHVVVTEKGCYAPHP